VPIYNVKDKAVRPTFQLGKWTSALPKLGTVGIKKVMSAQNMALTAGVEEFLHLDGKTNFVASKGYLFVSGGVDPSHT
jgi:hypothetical protein